MHLPENDCIFHRGMERVWVCVGTNGMGRGREALGDGVWVFVQCTCLRITTYSTKIWDGYGYVQRLMVWVFDYLCSALA